MKKEGTLPSFFMGGIGGKRVSPWGLLAASVAGSLIAATVGTFADEMLEWFKENKMKSKSKEYYIEMLKAHPSLKKQDSKLVAQYWASLFHFAPHMAADPLSSGAFIRQSIDRGYPELYGGPPVDTYSTLTGIEKSVADSKGKGKGVGSEMGIDAGTKFLSQGASTAFLLRPELNIKKEYPKTGSYNKETVKIAVQIAIKV